ncbi:MAG: stearoyl-CoA 9-desaturase [Fibrobacteres bacterium]|nr:stearoyl-CoA 9-desaturase [Fibrobacterota bacterium]
MPSIISQIGRTFHSIIRWLDNDTPQGATFGPEDKRVSHLRLAPFWAMHLACLAVFWVGTSPVAIAVAAALYFVRMHAITGWYHRYFSHRTFKTGRAMQFIFAFIGNSSAQRGALHWGAHHRDHHRFSDEQADPHSPRRHGFWVSHMLWFGKRENSTAKSRELKDFAKYPELMFLDRFDFVAPLCLAFGTAALGWLLNRMAPGLRTNGMQMLVWGFFISTIALYHGTFFINSLGHIMGRQRYRTGDDSKNSLLLALITLGEGWHNNHHHYANTVRQGFRWWEIDVSFYILWGFSKLGLVWDLKPVPKHLLEDQPAKAAVPGNPDWTHVPASAVKPGNADAAMPKPDETRFSEAA